MIEKQKVQIDKIWEKSWTRLSCRYLSMIKVILSHTFCDIHIWSVPCISFPYPSHNNCVCTHFFGGLLCFWCSQDREHNLKDIYSEWAIALKWYNWIPISSLATNLIRGSGKMLPQYCITSQLLVLFPLFVIFDNESVKCGTVIVPLLLQYSIHF